MRSVRCLVAAALAVAAFVPVPSAAQIEPRTCGILDGPGCNPNQCGILDGPGCHAQAQVGGASENLLLTLGTQTAADATKPEGELNSIRDLFASLRACWTPPAPENAHRGMQMSMRFALSRDGRLIGEPRVTYATRRVNRKTRDLYRDAIARSLRGCVPFPFTGGFAGAIAGRPIVIRVIDNRSDLAE